MSDDYACVQRGTLSLKGVVDGGIKKKKKKKKSKDKDKDVKAYLKQLEARTDSASDDEVALRPPIDKRTPAEIAFDRAKEKKEKGGISDKAALTHKQRITEFNRKLDSLTEHFDIPKVSWTK